MTSIRTPLPKLVLALATFAIGTTKFVIMGILPDVAAYLGVSPSVAGLLVTGYAIGVAIGATPIVWATARFPRKPTLMALPGPFIAAKLLCALAPSYGLLMLSRVVASFAHGSYFGIGAVVATGLVPTERRGAQRRRGPPIPVA